MLRNRILFYTCFFAVLLGTSYSFASDIRFDVTVNKEKVSLGDTINLNLAFQGTQDISPVDLPDIYGFDWKYLGPSSRMSVVNGKVSSSVTHMYVLIPLEVGEFSVPPLSIYYKGKTYKSDPISIEVVSGPVSQAPAKARTKFSTDTYEGKIRGLDDKIFVVIEAGKRSAYINEVIPIKVKLFINKLAIKEIQYPEIEHEGFSIGEFGEPRQYTDAFQGMSYYVIEFSTDAFGTRPGELSLGPVELKCNLLMKKKQRSSSVFDDDFFGPDPFDRFFGGVYEKYPLNLKSNDIAIVIKALPAEGVPKDFDGAIGDYEFRVEASSEEVKVGDPITLKMTITGVGNFGTVNIPVIEADGDFKVYDPEIKQDRTGKTFEQVIIPKNTLIKEVPEVSFSFFDTNTDSYRTLKRGPIPIKVKALPAGEKMQIFETPESATRVAQKREILGRDIIYIKSDPGALREKGDFFCKKSIFVPLEAVPIVVFIAIFFLYRRKEHLASDIRYARRLRAPGKARRGIVSARAAMNSKDTNKFFDAVFKTLQEYVGDRFHLSTAGITLNVAESLKIRGVEGKTLDKLKACFEACDRARYAASTVTEEDMKSTMKLLEEVIDELERSRS